WYCLIGTVERKDSVWTSLIKLTRQDLASARYNMRFTASPSDVPRWLCPAVECPLVWGCALVRARSHCPLCLHIVAVFGNKCVYVIQGNEFQRAANYWAEPEPMAKP